MHRLPRPLVVRVFLVFALAYFLSALLRAITATLSPTLTQELSLQAGDLGLLAGGYFLGFSLTQLPLGVWLDVQGPRRVILGFLSVAVAGCLAFAVAERFATLWMARVLCGVGVSACLMAPLTGYRRWLDAATLLRANSWMLMTGSMGMVAATLPVQWLLPHWGWRPLFWGLAVLLVLAMGLIAWQVPAWPAPPASPPLALRVRYAPVWRSATLRRLVPLGFINYGGLLAVQTLWAVPWMTRVAGASPAQAAAGLFWINMAMMATFWTWGLVNPRLARRGWGAERLLARGMPLSLAVLAVLTVAGGALGPWTPVALALYCVSSSVVTLSQPAVGMAFGPELAGRALSAYNLVIFAGVFVVQWGIGLLVDVFQGLGWTEAGAFQAALSVYLMCSLWAYTFFLLAQDHNPSS